MIIIIALSLPSYAALSASDGSIFITKTELDNALTDFNNRLTTFEGGMNSKIDSQITSYLDGNGIWNGKLQTMEAVPTGKMGWDFKNYKNGSNLYVYNGSNPLRSFNWQNYCYSAELNSLDAVVVKSTDKSGLCNLFINISENPNAVQTGQWGSWNNAHQDWWGSIFTSDIFIDTIDIGGSRNHAYNINWTTVFSSAATYKLTFPTIVNAYFFVNKNDQINFVYTGSNYNATTPIYSCVAVDTSVSINSWKATVY